MNIKESEFFLYIPSHNDSEAVVQSVRSSPEWDTIFIVDNCSDAAHSARLRSLACDRIEVIRHNTNIGRVENWKYCVEHFCDSAPRDSWFRFLAAGDEHQPGALERFRALTANPAVELLVCGVEHVGPPNGIWRRDQRPVVYDSATALSAAAALGNIWHSLSAVTVHRRALDRGYEFGAGALSYCADMLFTASLARHTPTHFVPDVLVKRVESHRKTYRALQGTMEATLEEGLVRQRCAQWSCEFGADSDEPTRRIAEWTRRRLQTATNGIGATTTLQTSGNER